MPKYSSTVKTAANTRKKNKTIKAPKVQRNLEKKYKTHRKIYRTTRKGTRRGFRVPKPTSNIYEPDEKLIINLEHIINTYKYAEAHGDLLIELAYLTLAVELQNDFIKYYGIEKNTKNPIKYLEAIIHAIKFYQESEKSENIEDASFYKDSLHDLVESYKYTFDRIDRDTILRAMRKSLKEKKISMAAAPGGAAAAAVPAENAKMAALTALLEGASLSNNVPKVNNGMTATKEEEDIDKLISQMKSKMTL
jgi:hypothetical protein